MNYEKAIVYIKIKKRFALRRFSSIIICDDDDEDKEEVIMDNILGHRLYDAMLEKGLWYFRTDTSSEMTKKGCQMSFYWRNFRTDGEIEIKYWVWIGSVCSLMRNLFWFKKRKMELIELDLGYFMNKLIDYFEKLVILCSIFCV